MSKNTDLTNAAALLGRKGGLAGSAKLTPEARKRRAQRAAAERWGRLSRGEEQEQRKGR